MMEDECEVDNYSKWIIRLELDRTKMLDKNITMDDIHFAIYNSYKEEVQCVYSDYNSEELVFRLRMKVNSKIANSHLALDQTDEIYKLTNFRDYLLSNLQIQGISSISKVILRKNPHVVLYEEDRYVRKDIWVLDTVGSNLQEVLALDYIDKTRTISNSIMEVYKVLGIEAARQSIYNEFVEVLEDNDTYINERHLTLLCDRMTYSTVLVSIFRHGINNDDIGPLAKASFEETPEQFLKAARHAELDSMRGISANVMCGQEGYFGTNSFDTFLDLNVMKQYQETIQEDVDYQAMLESIDDPNDPCNKSNMGTYSLNVTEQDTGCPDDDYDIDI
jgi:DNA-directed RNA polymerase II subunit RPB1